MASHIQGMVSTCASVHCSASRAALAPLTFPFRGAICDGLPRRPCNGWVGFIQTMTPCRRCSSGYSRRTWLVAIALILGPKGATAPDLPDPSARSITAGLIWPGRTSADRANSCQSLLFHVKQVADLSDPDAAIDSKAPTLASLPPESLPTTGRYRRPLQLERRRAQTTQRSASRPGTVNGST